MFRNLLNFLLKAALYTLVIALIVGGVAYLQGPSKFQFIGPVNIYTIQPWILALAILLLWVVWRILKSLLRGFFLGLPSVISARVRRGLDHLHGEHLHRGAMHLVRGHSDEARSNLARYVKEIPDQRQAFQLWAMAVHSLLASQETSNARKLFDIHDKKVIEDSSDDLTRSLLRVRLLIQEGKRQAALTALLNALGRHSENAELSKEMVKLIEEATESGASLLALSEVDDSEIPAKVRDSRAWRLMRALQRLREGAVDDEWINSLDGRIRANPSFVLARVRRLRDDSRIDECYEVALPALRESWSPELAEIIRHAGQPANPDLLDEFRALAGEPKDGAQPSGPSAEAS